MIFERVKEEIRAGRSIRQGIITGYRKGLTAIIDANVVTIMTAFILFVLAVSDVKGFAFTLGIGTFVSLFTAVHGHPGDPDHDGRLAGDIEPLAARRAAGKKRVWRFDFMGASRYFFTMSGVILLVGALAIGGRGLNLGIDFTSGTRIVGARLSQSATSPRSSSVLSAAGAATRPSSRISQQGARATMSSRSRPRQLGPQRMQPVHNALQRHFGLRRPADQLQPPSAPTFGTHGGQQRRDRDHRLADRDLGLRGTPIRAGSSRSRC